MSRDELVARHLPLAIGLARRYRSATESQDDLVQVAALALVKAVDRFDPDRHASLSSYAVPTILGELKRHFRDRSWAVRPPRDLQELALRTVKADAALSRRLGRSPTVAELSAELGVSSEQVIEARDAARAYSAVPLDTPFEDGEEGREGSLGAEDPGYRQVEQRAVLGSLMAQLEPREREILRLRFMDDLTQSEIAERMGLSQMHVSRLIRRSLAALQEAAQSDGSS
ncbi:MAG: SigB/SigF/SigG family RNA polymerase sigma factor [Thermoleophilaceae bacterium]